MRKMRKLMWLFTLAGLFTGCNYPEVSMEDIQRLATIKFESYNIVSDNNGDGIVNKGEAIKLQVNLKNGGTLTVRSVKATFSTTSSYVSELATSQISYGDISANMVADDSRQIIEFTVSNTTPADTQILIDISIVDNNGNTWTDSFSLTVEATGAQITYHSDSIYSDNNEDNIVNKGETIKLRVNLKNIGTSAAKGVKATFSTTSPYVSQFMPISQVNYSDISANTIKGGYNDTIRFTVSDTTPSGTQIAIIINIIDETNNIWTESFNITVVATAAQIAYNSYSVYSDNNGDKIVNNGETVSLRISLKNTGTSAAKSVKATFSTSSSYVSQFTPTSQITYGDIAANTVKWANYAGTNSVSEFGITYTVSFTISATMPLNTPIPINISVVDESNNTWTASFNVMVEVAQITYNSYSIYSDNNGDKIVNKGETVSLRVSLKNIGTGTAKGVNATFSTTSSYVSGFTPISQINYGNISANTEKWASFSGTNSVSESEISYTVQFAISNTTPVDTQIPISISIVDNIGNTWTESFNVTVATTAAEITYDNYSVYSDNNGDKVVNKGETIALKVSLKNIGTSASKGIKATFSTNSLYVSGLTPTGQINYGDIAANTVKWANYSGSNSTSESGINYYTIRFAVSNTTPSDTQIPISISIVDESNNTWTESFNVMVTATSAQMIYNSYSVYSDNNGDNIINKGETIDLQVSLKNTGTSAAKGVKATFSTTSSYVSDLTPTGQIDYGDISANTVKWADYSGTNSTSKFNITYTVRVVISNTASVGTQIPVDISIIDESNNTWTETFNITVEATNAQIKYDSYSVYSDNNGDEIVNKGETVNLLVNLKNIGTSAANGVKATFSTNSAHISNLTATQIDYGNISAETIMQGYSAIQFAVSNSAPAGTQISIDISVVDESNNIWTDSFSVTIEATGAQITYNNHSIIFENNNDKVINRGETVYLRVYLNNTGTSKANSVMATFSTNSPYISDFTPTTQVSYGDISPESKNDNNFGYYNSIGSNYYTFKFTASNSTPIDTQATIDISIVDESNNMWTESFNITIADAQISYNSYSVYSDNNGDKIINKGEKVSLRISLKNIGPRAAKGIKATFSTESSYVSEFTPVSQINYGDIAVNTVKWADYNGNNYISESGIIYYTIQFTVSNTTPADTQIPINISIVDENGITWAESFNLTVEATGAQIAYNSNSVYSDNNGDKIINNGETVSLRVSLKNNGTSRANGVKATFSTENLYISGLTPTGQINYGNVSAQTVKWADYSGNNYELEYYITYTIRFTVSTSTPDSTQIPINIDIVDESGNTWTENFNVTVSTAQITYNSQKVYSDNNGDKIVNNGETIGLQVSLKNIGTGTANGVKATFSSTSSYVSGFTPIGQINYGDISANTVKWADYWGYNGQNESNIHYYTIQFAISGTTPANTQIPINISLVDNNGNTWTSSFNVTVEATAAQMTYNSYSVYSDNNGDKIINKGETVGLKISLKNNGTSTAKGVKATFSTESEYVSGLTPTGQINYGDVSADMVKWARYDGANNTSESGVTYTIQFTVSKTTPANTQIPISISIVDESGNTWTASFNVTVIATAAQIIYDSYNVYSDNNGDKIVNKGETVSLQVNLKNSGTSTANAVQATFSTTSSYVSGMATSLINYGNISANTGKIANIQFTVSNTTPANTQIPISINIVDESGNTWTASFNVSVEATGAQITYNSNSVYSDTNGDKIINNGETVFLKISLKNTGTSTAKEVKATFSTMSSYISGLTPTGQLNYGDVSANNTVKWANYSGNNSPYESGITYTISFIVSKTTPAGTQIPISISIVDESNNTWTASFNVTVTAGAQMAYNIYSVYSDTNGDKIINKGETVSLKISLKNTETSLAKGVKATFSTTSSYISGFTPTGQINYGDVPANTEKWARYDGYNSTSESGITYTIQFTVSSTTPAGTQIPISISIVDERTNTWTASFNIAVY